MTHRGLEVTMEVLGPAPERPRNRILRSLGDSYAALVPALERVRFTIRELIYDIDQPIEHVYFVESGVISVVAAMGDGSAVETATVGYEGMAGIPVFLGTDRSASQAFCQIDGEALRMRSPVFQRAAEDGIGFRRVLNRYTQALFTQLSQSSACNRIHTMRQRCARWLLQTHDRVGADEFALTHQFLSQMLGVRRATVTEVASALQSDGLIEYSYGRLRVTNRAGLERASCECYAIVRSEFDRLVDGRETPSPLDGVRASRDGKSTLGDGTPVREREGVADD